jgi:AraC family transcriptional regulator, regulatory protein of adaptative response / methylated-DNA-[protein]-cysteine methyltransferase
MKIITTDDPTILNDHHNILQFSLLDTPIGTMLAIANEQALYVLEFVDQCDVEHKIEKFKIKTKSAIIPGRTCHIDSIEQELALYFAGRLKEFKTPVHLVGSPFQQNVWNSLLTIPYGTTISYAQEARAIGKPSAHRAVANANGANQLTIIIPCHRIIQSNGNLGGYGAGIARKQWLLDHEKKNI